MTGSVAPIYRREFADVHYDGSAEAYVNDNVYKAYNALNSAPSYHSTNGTRSLLGSAAKMADPTREEIQAQIATSEARTETKIARLEGKLDLVLEAVREGRNESRDNRRAIIANGWVIFGALIVVIGILVTVAPVIFDMGFKWRETLTKEVQDRIPQVSTKPQK